MGMTWDHRIMLDKDGTFSVREVYYNEDDEVRGWTVMAVPAIGGSVSDLRSQLRLMLDACDRTILNERQLHKELRA